MTQFIALFFTLVFSTFALSQEAPRSAAFKVVTNELLFGSFGGEFEVRANEHFSLTLPFFFADHDAAIIPNQMFWSSSTGIRMGARYYPLAGPDLASGFYVGIDTGTFVIYPFEAGNKGHYLGGNSVYSEFTKSPVALWVGSLHGGFQHVYETGLLVEGNAGLAVYHGGWALPEVKFMIGYAF